VAGNVVAVTGGKTLTIFLAADLKKFNSGINQAQGGLTGLAGSMKNMLGPAAIGAGIAIAGLATKMAVDGVQSALADEEAMRKLALTMENVGLAHDTQRVEDYISVLERSTGVADDDLRPAYDRLIRSIGDTEEAERMLSLSMDISAGTGKSLSAVTEALGKAYDGNTVGLSRLGAGIDAAILRSGDMNAITETLANTFTGQAAESADTLNGRIKVLQQAVDNLGEAFGKGLLTGVQDATEGTADMVKTMQEFEPMLESLGEGTANLAGDLVGLAGFLFDVQGEIDKATQETGLFGTVLGTVLNRFNPFGQALDYLGIAMDFFGGASEDAATAIGFTAVEARKAVPQWNALTGAVRMTTQQYIDYLNANKVGNGILKDANADYQDLAARQAKVNTWTYEYTGIQTDATKATSSASSAVEDLTEKEKELLKIFETKNQSRATNREALGFWTGELSTANQAIEDFTTSMQQNLSAGIDLGAAYTAAKEGGGNVGEGVVTGFQAMIDEAKWMGNVLNALKAQGVDPGLITYLSEQGADIAGNLGEAMLGDKGLLSTLNEKWVGVQETTRTLAEGLVPEFLIAGQQSALTMVDSISEQMAKEVNRLAKIGKKIAKPLGQSFRAELMKDVAAALREVEAAGTAGRAEAVATAQARQVALTNQAVAQALQNLVRSADARNGLPIAPVLS
jgi:hypothetical protein